MKAKIALLSLLTTTLLSAAAHADYPAAAYLSETIYSRGTLTVNKAFTLKPTGSHIDRLTNKPMKFAPGAYKISLNSGSYDDNSVCLVAFCTHGQVRSTLEISWMDKKDNVISSVKFLDESNGSRSGDWSLLAKKSRQEVNMFAKIKIGSEQLNYRTETQECQVEAYYTSGGGGLFGGGGGTTYALGKQQVRMHDDKATKYVQIKFTNAANEVVATYKGIQDYTVSVTGEELSSCKLNIQQN